MIFSQLAMQSEQKDSDTEKAEAGRHTGRPLDPTSLLSRVSSSRLLRAVCSHILVSPRGNSTNYLDNLSQCLTSLAVNAFQRNSTYFYLCPWHLVLSLGIAEESLALSPSLPALHQVFTPINKILPSLFSSRLQSSLSFSSHNRHPNPCSLQGAHVCGTRDARRGGVPHQCWVEGKHHHLPWPGDAAWHSSGRSLVAFFPHKDRLLAPGHRGCSRPFSRELLSQQISPSPGAAPCISLCWRHKIAVTPLLQPAQVPLKGSTTIWCSSCSSGLCITCKAAEGAALPQPGRKEESRQCWSQYGPLGWTTESCFALKSTNKQLC